MYKVKIVIKNMMYKTNLWFYGFIIIKIKTENDQIQ